MADKCLRTILVAYKDIPMEEYLALEESNNNFMSEQDRESVEGNLIIVSIFGIKDPLRPGVKEAVMRCNKSGIRVRMCTGDNIHTATAISKEAGIINEEDLRDTEHPKEYLCMEGHKFSEMVGPLKEVVGKDGKTHQELSNMRAFKDIEKDLKVLARSSPEDKLMLVTGLKELGKIVAVTGDGTNDAPALNRADVGFAMQGDNEDGEPGGSDIAKNAADIILTDDNFCSILVAVKYGRNIYDCIRKFLQFQLTVNIVALILVFVGSIVLQDAPFTAVQMLWVNIIMDTFAALALATEPPTDELFERQPYNRQESIINTVMWRNILGQAVYQIFVVMMLLLLGRKMFDYDFEADTPFYPTDDYLLEHPLYNPQSSDDKLRLYTMVFQTFVFMQGFNQINARCLGEKEWNCFKGLCNNWIFIAIVIVTFSV